MKNTTTQPPAPAPAKKPKTTERTLRYSFTSMEKMELGIKLANTLSDIVQIEQDLDKIKTEFKSRTASAEASLNAIRDKINSGYEMRQTKCEIHLDKPEAGRATVIRLDTGEVVETRDMTEAEKQAELELTLADEPKDGKIIGLDGKIKDR